MTGKKNIHARITKEEWLSSHSSSTNMEMVNYYLTNKVEDFEEQSHYYLACALEYALYSYNENTDFYHYVIEMFEGILSKDNIMDYLEGYNDSNRFASANNMEYTSMEWIDMYVASSKRKRKKIYMCVTPDALELPVDLDTDYRKLAERHHIKPDTLLSLITKTEKGKIKDAGHNKGLRFVRVVV